MKDIDGNEVGVGDIVRLVSVNQEVLDYCQDFVEYSLSGDQNVDDLALLTNDYRIDGIFGEGTKASVSIELRSSDGLPIGGLFMLAEEFRLLQKKK
ncbi:MAG: hypothetical protein V4857_18510 [Pseudomonadota bacterium]